MYTLTNIPIHWTSNQSPSREWTLPLESNGIPQYPYNLAWSRRIAFLPKQVFTHCYQALQTYSNMHILVYQQPWYRQLQRESSMAWTAFVMLYTHCKQQNIAKVLTHPNISSVNILYRGYRAVQVTLVLFSCIRCRQKIYNSCSWNSSKSVPQFQPDIFDDCIFHLIILARIWLATKYKEIQWLLLPFCHFLFLFVLFLEESVIVRSLNVSAKKPAVKCWLKF